MSRFVRGLFRRRALFLPLTRRPRQAHPEDPPPAPVRTFVRWYSCTYARHCVVYLIFYIYLTLIFFVRILISCLTLFFSRGSHVSFPVFTPLTVLRHADRTALFQGFAVVCFLDLLTPLLVCIVRAINRLGSQPSKVGTVSTLRHLQPAVATGR